MMLKFQQSRWTTSNVFAGGAVENSTTIANGASVSLLRGSRKSNPTRVVGRQEAAGSWHSVSAAPKTLSSEKRRDQVRRWQGRLAN